MKVLRFLHVILNFVQLVLSHRRVFLPSLIRLSISALPLQTLTTLPAASREFVTMNTIRRNNSPSCHSILQIILRALSQLFAW